MSRWFLGIDTSNYRTSAGLYCPETREWKNSGRLLEVPEGTIGLRQSDAVFQHNLYLSDMIAGLPAGIAQDIEAVCVSTAPRAIEGSYMPCFLVGQNVAASIAHILGVPLYACSHQIGHIAAAALSAGVLDWLTTQEFYAWHVSGGTTELLHVCTGENNGGLPYATRIGGTSDLAAGQLIDRTAALLGLPFPGGEHLEKLADQSDYATFFRSKVENSTFSLSGIENKVKNLYAKETPPEKIAGFTIHTIASALELATLQACKERSLPVLCAGGVMSNRFLQNHMAKLFDARFAEPTLSGDNAVGVAVVASLQHPVQMEIRREREEKKKDSKKAGK